MRVVLHEGGGPPPGSSWSVVVLDRARSEAAEFLSVPQYQHLAEQFRELARQGDPTHSATVSVRKIEDYWEVRDKGGILGNLNVRVFFGVDEVRRRIVVLGMIAKQYDGPTPLGDVRRMRRRWRLYRDEAPE